MGPTRAVLAYIAKTLVPTGLFLVTLLRMIMARTLTLTLQKCLMYFSEPASVLAFSILAVIVNLVSVII